MTYVLDACALVAFLNDEAGAEEIEDLLNQSVSAPVFHSAAHIKARYTCSLADAIGLGTAFDLSGAFVTSDGEIKPVDMAEPVTVRWFRPPKEKQVRQKPDVNAIIRRAEKAERALAEANRRIAELEALL
jgi:hypothetical protein